MQWKTLLRRRKLDDDLAEEIAFHLRMAAADRQARGESASEAARNARREFGSQLLVSETTRDLWGWGRCERLWQDLRYALRQMRRNPGFTAVALLTLALGLGAATAIFSIVDTVLLRPLQFREQDRLYSVENIPPADAGLTRNLPVNARHFHEWREHCRACEGIALFQGSNLTLVGAGEPLRLPALDVSYNFFRTLGIQPALGRDFVREEEGTFSGKVMLSDALWRSRFASDPAIVGRAIRMNGEPYVVVGILPANQHLPRGGEWGAFVGPAGQPLAFRPLLGPPADEFPSGSLNYSSVVRLRPGVREAQAASELNALLADFVRQYGIRTRIGLTPLQTQVIRRDRGPLLLLLGAVGMVLLIVCVNVGNLMLIRTTGRGREAGVRMALGASRTRLFSLVLMEALALVSAGGVAGLALAWAGLKIFVAQAPVSIPRLDEVRMDWRVLLFAGACVALSAVLCGILPAWRLARMAPLESLKAGSGATDTAGRLWFREALVGLEVALSTLSLIAGALLMASFFRLVNVDKGFEIAHVITQEVSFLNPKYSHGIRRGFLEETVEKLSRIPGVQAIGAVSQLPLLGEEWVTGLRDPDRLLRPGDENATANCRFVTPGYFQAMGIRLLRGRLLQEADRDRPTAVVSERAARVLWGNANPIGKHVRGAGPSKPRLEVVGVVAEVRSKLEDTPAMMIYEHFWRMQPVVMSFVLRTQSDPALVGVSIRSVLAASDPDMAMSPARTMEQILYESVASRRFQMWLAAAFAIAALLLASMGIYGVLSFAVARRTNEMGVRLALGASRGQLAAMVVRQGMAPVAGGLAAGVVGALFAGRLIASQLFGVRPDDPLSIAAVAALLVAVALAACWIPARRATRIDPLAALRFE